MSEDTLFPLALLYVNGCDSVDGETRMQKLVFLAQEEAGAIDAFAYHADNFGGYSYDLTDTLDTLIDKGLIERNRVTNEAGNTRHDFSITNKGIRYAKRMLNVSKYDHLFEAAVDVKTQYNNLGIRQLLRYVYQSYPEYATETILDTDRLFDTNARSQFLDEDTTPEFAGGGPDAMLSENTDPDEFF